MNSSTGRALGGGGRPTNDGEIRQRRLAALGDRGSVCGAANTTTATAASTSTNSLSPPFRDEGGIDDDMELQAALALSLGRTEGALGPIPTEVSPSTMLDLVAADSLQEPNRAPGEERNGSDSYEVTVEEAFEIAKFHASFWDTGLTTDGDKARWLNQGIDYRGDNADTAQVPHGMEEGTTMLSVLTTDHGPWGLVQSHGGPCGVLAAIQAETLRILLYGRRDPIDYPPVVEPGRVPVQAKPHFTSELARQSLARAIAIILARAAVMHSASASGSESTGNTDRKCSRIVLPSFASHDVNISWQDLEPWISNSSAEANARSTSLTAYTVSSKDSGASNAGSNKRQKINGRDESRDEQIIRLARATTSFLLDEGLPGRTAPLDCFRRAGGVMLLAMSLFATRGQAVIQGEMDDPIGTKLTAQFGHCGQELINLLLTGQAVSNVFDNTLTPSGDLTCRGIQFRPDIGYLSQLEALRYCEVGGYYKSPKYPIWVVGSTSHFTVLFGDVTCLKESESDQLLEKCRRAFKTVEGGEENGFIASSNLGVVLKSLDVNLGEPQYSALAASLEVSDAGIILWDDFWKATSRLMTGASLEKVLHDAPVGGGPAGTVHVDDVPPLLITQHGEPNPDNGVDRKPSARPTREESDEEMAKRLSSQWDLEVTATPATAAAAAPSSVSDSAMEVEPAAMSDEELARKLQAEWDAEVSGTATSSVAAVNGSQNSPHWNNIPDTTASSIATPDMTPVSTIDDSNPQDQREPIHKMDFEKYGDTFQLYHYNGLRGGTLTPFRVTRLSAEEAVGASIALNRGNNSHGGSLGGDLEDVVRTKWPSSAINWLGKSPPYID